jgi:dihydroflavonol-4-reductase
VPDTLVTGGSGFLGGALLRRLIDDGRSVRALVRSERAAETVRRIGADPVHGDVNDPESVRRAVDGCRTVFHVAGVNEMCLRDVRTMHRINVEGSQIVVRAAAAAGVQRLVYTSSATAVGEPPGVTATEDTRFSGIDLSAYAESKRRGEEIVFAEAAAAGLPVVAVNPASVQGPGRTGGTARILLAYLRGRLRFAVDTIISLVFIDDCTEAHLRAEALGIPGERYLVSGVTLTVEEALDTLRAVTGVDHEVRFLPLWTVSLLAPIVAAGSRLIGRPPPLCGEMVRVMRHGASYDGSRIRELGLVYTPLEEWLARTVEWYRAEGLVG